MTGERPTIALDLSSVCGYAVGTVFGRPLWGEWSLGPLDDGSNGRRFSCLANELEQAVEFHKPGMIVYEAPFARGEGATRLLMGLPAIVEMVAFEHGRIPVRQANVSKVRKLALGHGRLTSPNPRLPKLPYLTFCKDQGWDCGDKDNAADALILLRAAHILQRSRVTAGWGSIAA